MATAWLSLVLSAAALAAPTPEYIRRNAVRVGPSLPGIVVATLARRKAIAVGEIHGTKEGPAFLLTLARSLSRSRKSLLLGLEVPSSEQKVLDEFWRTGQVSGLKRAEFFRRAYQDGRSSRAMAELLRGLRALPGVRVVAFDVTNATSGQDRDEKMAGRLAAAYRKYRPERLLFLAGNLHASTAVGNPFDPAYRPMAYEMEHRPGSGFSAGDIFSIKIRNLDGSAWVCLSAVASECGVRPMVFGPSPYSEAVPWHRYYLPETPSFEGYDATFFTRALSASAPLVPAVP